MAALGIWRRPLQALQRRLTTVSRNDSFLSRLEEELQGMRTAGTFKVERVLESPQSGAVTVAGGSKPVLNFCANNYLGLSSHPALVQAAQETLSSHGFGLSSVRFICGTQDVHKKLEAAISEFHGTEDTILFPSCFDANAGLFEACLGPEDAVISDALNHASIIDGIRLCKAQRHRYNHMDMAHLEEILKECVAKGTRQRMIVTDGVFSMDGDIAPLREICDLADKYEAQVFVDECHATGFLAMAMWWEIRPQSRDRHERTFGERLADSIAGFVVGAGLGTTAGTISLLGYKPEFRTTVHGDKAINQMKVCTLAHGKHSWDSFSSDLEVQPSCESMTAIVFHRGKRLFVEGTCHPTQSVQPGATGKGTPELCGVSGRVDIINSTLGKALGGATGGYTTGPKVLIDLLRNKARPYLFSNTLAPSVAGASLEVFKMLSNSGDLLQRLQANVKHFRSSMKAAGFKLSGHESCPIVPVMLGDARLASEMADQMLKRGIYVIGFSYPVVPKGAARIRVQMSAAHEPNQVQQCIDAFVEVGKAKGVI
eukprot:s4_g24.t2